MLGVAGVQTLKLQHHANTAWALEDPHGATFDQHCLCRFKVLLDDLFCYPVPSDHHLSFLPTTTWAESVHRDPEGGYQDHQCLAKMT